MTKCAVIKLLLPAQVRRVYNVLRFGLARVFLMKLNMSTSGTVATFAINPQHYLFSVKGFVALNWFCALKVSAVAFQAPCRNTPVEKYLIRGIPWAVAPAIAGGVIGNGQLEEHILLPE